MKSPDTRFKCLVNSVIGSTSLQTLVDTGAGPSCIAEHVMLSSPFFKQLVIKKCERKAFSVSGAPVVTLGTVDSEFKLNGASYTHTFIILRGLIHPMLLGLDFLTKFNANIQLGMDPSLVLRHPVLKEVVVKFLKPVAKTKPPTYVSLLSDIKIPPKSIQYVEAHLSNFEEIGSFTEDKPDRLIGITTI